MTGTSDNFKTYTECMENWYDQVVDTVLLPEQISSI